MASAFKDKRVAGGKLANGTEYEIIRGSLRPDGTRRPDIKVRKGYVPQEEMKSFETKGSRHREQQEEIKHWVPGMSPQMHQEAKARAEKLAREKQNARSSGRVSGPSPASKAKVPLVPQQEEPDIENDPEAIKRKVKSLKKKLKEIKELEDKKKEDLCEEQLQKLTRKDGLDKEIEDLHERLVRLRAS
eukprot:NODE_7803_length_742_cov_60.132472_g7552_i0.p1 GENE.NODE_7803_length_742_cov_60.132472_g7552_i0~~NODE_7803_length_742_cov_60.132472_g7552_i0.p1  ORF type:complete len:188 (+),score=35.09 NODE_7803_length_742_cov_60.132472_g7552_i0:80-643(+)